MKIRFLKALIVGCIIIALSFFFMYNIKNNDYFFQASLYNITLLIISVGVAYYLVQKRTDERRKKDSLEKLIERMITNIQDNLYNETFLDIRNRISILSNLRKIGNKIHILELACKDYIEVEKEVKYIIEKFMEIRNIYEDIMCHEGEKAIALANDKESDLKKHSNDIASKCDYILYKIYT